LRSQCVKSSFANSTLIDARIRQRIADPSFTHRPGRQTRSRDLGWTWRRASAADSRHVQINAKDDARGRWQAAVRGRRLMAGHDAYSRWLQGIPVRLFDRQVYGIEIEFA
jgi:hypothetical protein